jgi:hypothetical protein
MDPVTIGLIVQMGIKYGPEAAMALHAIFTTASPTPEQWAALWTSMKQSYSQATGLPPLPGV